MTKLAKQEHLAYIGLGSNLGQPAEQLEMAFESLNGLPHTQLLSRSQLYASQPQGPQDQPDYMNAVGLIQTALEPVALLKALQLLETQLGKIKKRHWGERLIDLDILLFDDQIVKTHELTIPHREMAYRDFVLLPLAEISAGLIIPGLGPVESLIEQLETTYVVPWQPY